MTMEGLGPVRTTGRKYAWMGDALCAQTDPDAFTPEKGGSTRDAKRTCDNCDVTADCLEYAMETDQKAGVWGGKSERERRALKKLGPGAVRATIDNLRRRAA